MADPARTRDGTRSRIVEVAARLLGEQGPTAVTTRAVAEAAGVQAPTIYRLFGDKDGLLDAVAELVMATFAGAKAAAHAVATDADRPQGAVDPLEDLRASWQTQIDFGVANPSVFRLLSDPVRVAHSAAAQVGRRVLEARVHRVAETGRLRVTERRAVDLIEAAGLGTIQLLLATPADRRDDAFAGGMYDTVLGQILADPPERASDGTTPAVVALRAAASGLTGLTVLSPAERALLAEWLDRVLDSR